MKIVKKHKSIWIAIIAYGIVISIITGLIEYTSFADILGRIMVIPVLLLLFSIIIAMIPWGIYSLLIKRAGSSAFMIILSVVYFFFGISQIYGALV